MKRPQAFCHRHRVSFYETDAMGVVHHSNYLRFFENARVDWINQLGLREEHYPHSETTLAVLESSTQHFRPAYFNDLLEIYLQVRRDKLKIYFQYVIYSERFEDSICRGEVILLPLNKNNKPTRLSARFIEILEKEKWTETWP